MKIDDLVQKDVKELSCYEVKTILDRKFDKEIVKMDFNENFVMDYEIIEKLLLETSRSVDVRSYPPPRGLMAIKAISQFLDINESKISVANGADELMDLLMKVFVRKGSKVMVIEPTFPMYAFYTQLFGGTKIDVRLKPNFELDVEDILKKVDNKTVLLFICSPNNPTGNQFSKDKIKKILNEFKGIVVIDEAYADFAQYSTIDWIEDYENLVVLRSFSKALGLAGLRLGYLVSNKFIVDYIKRVVAPFNVNSITQKVITIALQKWNSFENRIKFIINERKFVMEELKRIEGIAPFISESNFILFKVTKENLSSTLIKEKLERQNILVKDRGHLPLLDNCIRVTIGTRKMNENFLSSLKTILE